MESISTINLKFNDNILRSYATKGKIWFCVVDICKMLNLSHPSRVTKKIIKLTSEDHVTKFTLYRVGDTNFTDQIGLYNLTFEANYDLSQELFSWLTNNVMLNYEHYNKLSVMYDTFKFIQNKCDDLYEDVYRNDLLYDLALSFLNNDNSKTFTTTQVAKMFGLKCHNLNKILKKNKLVYIKNNRYVAHKKLVKNNLVKYNEFYAANGEKHITNMWTKKGIKLIYKTINK